MEIKDKIDIINKKADIANKKLIAFLAIAGGTWIYGVKEAIDNPIVTILSSIAFFIAVLGISTNLIKLGDLQTKLKDLYNE